MFVNKNMINEDHINRDMATRMKVKFEKHRSDYSVVRALKSGIDPRMRFSFLEFYYQKFSLIPISCQANLKVMKHKLYLFSLSICN